MADEFGGYSPEEVQAAIDAVSMRLAPQRLGRVRGVLQADGTIRWTGEQAGSPRSNIGSFLSASEAEQLSAGVAEELAARAAYTPPAAQPGIMSRMRDRFAARNAPEPTPPPSNLVQDIGGEGAERWQLASGGWTWDSPAIREAEALRTREGNRRASRLRREHEEEYRRREESGEGDSSETNAGREAGRQDGPGIWSQMRNRIIGGGRTGGAVGAGLAVLIGMGVGVMESVIGDILTFALQGLGATGQGVARIGMALFHVLAQGLRAAASVGGMLLGAAIGAILGPVVMGVIGALGGMIGAAVGTLVGTVSKALGDVLASTKQILDDLIGSAVRYSRAMSDMSLQTGMTGRATSGLLNILGALGVQTDTVSRAFGEWGSHLELLVARFGILGVNLRVGRDGTVDWANAFTQLRQRMQEIPEIMQLPYLRGALGAQRANALLPVLQAPEEQFQRSLAQAERNEETAGVGERVFARYRWVLDRLHNMVEMAKVRLADAFLPFVELITDKLEGALPALLERAMGLAERLPQLLVGGWNMLLDILILIVQMMPDVVSGFMQVMNTGRDMLNLLLQAAEIFSKILGVPTEFPRMGQFPWERGDEPMRDAGDVVDAIPGRADGGPVRRGRAYVVGEEGPELFVPGDNGRIVPHGNDGAGSESEEAPEESGTSKLIHGGMNLVGGLGIAGFIRLILWPLLRSIGPRIIGSIAGAGIGAAGGPAGLVIAGIVTLIIAAITAIKSLVNKGADSLREHVGEPPLDPIRRKRWEEAQDSPEARAKEQKEAEVLDRWRRRSEEWTQMLQGMRSSFDWLSHGSAAGTAGQGQVQKAEVTLKLPPGMYSEVGALELLNNTRLILQSTVS